MSNIENLTTAFKHVNIYEILEPQKVHNVQVATLVDISDDKSEVKPNDELIGSFMDKVSKPKFDILDVYENIYVTPQHLEPLRNNDLDVDIFIREDESNDEVDSRCDNASANVRTEQEKSRDIKVDCSISEISFPKLHRLGEKSINAGFIDDILKPKANLSDNVIKTSASINESVYNVVKLDRDQNLDTSYTKSDLNWETERSVLTLGQVPSAYPAMCGIQREADLKTVQLQNFIISTKKNKDVSNNVFGGEVKDDLKYDYFKPNLTSNQDSFDLSIASDVPIYKRIQELPKKQDDLTTFFNKNVQRNIQSPSGLPTKEITKDPTNSLSVLSKMSGGEFSQPKINFHIENCVASKISTINEKPVYKIDKPVQEVKNEDRNALFFKKLQDLLNQPSQDLKTAEDTKLSLSLLPNAKLDLKHIHTPQKLTEKNNFLENLYQYNIKSSLIDGNKVIKSLNHPPIPMLQTIKLNKKLFAKRIIKTENETMRYTKGPDIYEKSLILPQIMERLMIRNRNEAAKKNLTRKYILDCQNNGGGNSAFVMPELVTEVVIEDCNKERLKALKVRKAFEEFVKGKI